MTQLDRCYWLFAGLAFFRFLTFFNLLLRFFLIVEDVFSGAVKVVAGFEIGMLHYASDTPMSKGKNLGASNLSYYGMDPTYATTVTVLRRILELETQYP